MFSHHFYRQSDPQRCRVTDILREVQDNVTNLIHQHDYDRQLSKHLERQGPPWDDCVLEAEA